MSHKIQQRRFSNEGFQPLVNSTPGEMANPQDITIDIPMIKISKRATTRFGELSSPAKADPSIDGPEALNEKTSRLPFHRGPAGRRRKLEDEGKGNKHSQDGSLNVAGRFYKKIFNFSIITRYFLYVAPLALAIAVPIVVGATAAKTATIGGVRILWFFTWVEVVWVSLWVSKLFAHVLPYIFQFLCGVVSPGTRKYALVLSALEIPISLVGWAATCLPTFVTLMSLNPDQRRTGDTGLKPWQSIVKNILFACLFSSIIFLGEKLLIQLISISYHRKQFDEKIKDSKHNIHLVSLLYDASRTLFPAYRADFAEEDYLISNALDLGSGLNTRHDHMRSGSNTPMKLLRKVGRAGDKVTSAFGNMAHEITGKKVFNPNAAHSVVIHALEKQASCEALARRLWLSFVLEGHDALYPEDIADVLGPEQATDAEDAFECLDIDGNGDISLDEMVLRLGELARERNSLASSMHDVDQAINVLDSLLLAVVLLIVVFIFLAWLNRNFTTTLATAGTALLSLSFVFAGTAQEFLGSCIFLFVKHPFDVGDRVDIGEARYVVERISLLYTLFRKVQDHKRTQVPNIVLNSLWIDNVSRSKAMREQIHLYVHFDTTLEDIELLKKEMISFVRDKENSRDFQPDIEVEVTGLAEMNKLELKIEIKHKSNWANESVRAARRSKFMCALVIALRKVPIYCPAGGAAPAGDMANPNYSVAISAEEAQQNKSTFSHNKDQKRMVPLNPDKPSSPEIAKSSSIDLLSKTASVGSEGSGSKETAALQVLNRRNFATDPARDTYGRTDKELERKRTNDIEEIRGILRRESLTGRRRPTQTKALSPELASTRFGSQSIPAVMEVSPAEPLNDPLQPKDSYFEDNTYAPAARGQLSPSQARYVPPLQTTAAAALADQSSLDSATKQSMWESPRPISPGRTMPGNAFSPQTPPRQRTPPPSRKPLPGAPELKEYLQSPK